MCPKCDYTYICLYFFEWYLYSMIRVFPCFSFPCLQIVLVPCSCCSPCCSPSHPAEIEETAAAAEAVVDWAGGRMQMMIPHSVAYSTHVLGHCPIQPSQTVCFTLQFWFLWPRSDVMYLPQDFLCHRRIPLPRLALPHLQAKQSSNHAPNQIQFWSQCVLLDKEHGHSWYTTIRVFRIKVRQTLPPLPWWLSLWKCPSSQAGCRPKMMVADHLWCVEFHWVAIRLSSIIFYQVMVLHMWTGHDRTTYTGCPWWRGASRTRCRQSLWRVTCAVRRLQMAKEC